MILTAHQPVYLPWLGLFHKIALADTFCFFDCVQYHPKDWNNRNKIKFSSGKADWLSVPVLRVGYLEKSFTEIKINNSEPWRRKHWMSIELSYKKAKCFHTYAEGLKQFYEREWEYLVDLNYEMLLFFLKKLNIPVKTVKMSDYSFKGEKSDLVLDMCLKLKADKYIFGELGRDYADIEKFKSSGMIPYFQKYNHPIYHQIHGNFIPNLSIIDLLFNCGEKSLGIIMNGNAGKDEIQALTKSNI